MATQAAGNAASAAASGVSNAAAAAASAGAAQAGMAGAVAGAAQSAGVAGTAAAATAAAATAAAVTAASVGAFGPAAVEQAVTCTYDNLAFREGTVVTYMQGFTRIFSDREANLIESVVVDAYNDASGICAELFQREMVNATLAEQTLIDGTPSYVETKFDCFVKCDGCSIEEPLFSYRPFEESDQDGNGDDGDGNEEGQQDLDENSDSSRFLYGVRTMGRRRSSTNSTKNDTVLSRRKRPLPQLLEKEIFQSSIFEWLSNSYRVMMASTRSVSRVTRTIRMQKITDPQYAKKGEYCNTTAKLIFWQNFLESWLKKYAPFPQILDRSGQVNS